MYLPTGTLIATTGKKTSWFSWLFTTGMNNKDFRFACFTIKPVTPVAICTRKVISGYTGANMAKSPVLLIELVMMWFITGKVVSAQAPFPVFHKDEFLCWYFKSVVKIYSIYNDNSIIMPAVKRIPVSETVWKKLGEMKGAGQTYDDLLEDMIERVKKARLEEDVKIWESCPDSEYVSLPVIRE
jgi:hypothetical protein